MRTLRKAYVGTAAVALVVAMAAVFFVSRRPAEPVSRPAAATAQKTDSSEVGQSVASRVSVAATTGLVGGGGDADKPKPADASPKGQPVEAAPIGGSGRKPPPHPLLGDEDSLLLSDRNVEVGELRSSPGSRPPSRTKLAEVGQAMVRASAEKTEAARLTIDYPLDGTIFPPEIVPPTFLWHDPVAEADTWLIDVAFHDRAERLRVIARGSPAPPGEIDPRCIAKNNEIYQPTPYQASARSWTVGADVWAAIRRRSVETPARLTVFGFRSSEPGKVLSRGAITLSVSKDPVGAPIFYRDVPLAPAVTRRGVIAPLGENAIGLIAWRLRDIGKPNSRLLLTGVPTCTNCHSFSDDGNTLGMDLDGPTGDKGAYVLAPLRRETVIHNDDVISWNAFPEKPKGRKTIGFLSRVSPDGQHVVTTLNEELFVANFLDYRFLQVFYPTRGILGYYSRATGQIKALPGADGPNYVHCDPVWTPDGEYLIFARAEARDAYPKDFVFPERANDPNEPQIQYDLYRIPFRGGRGGKPEPLAGASRNGMSNSFPKVSPDGKWVVFVQARNGQLMRPDSTLWIVPATGGTARKMRCNTPLMNSWHSFSPNGRWMVFSSKANTPYTQMFLTHIDEDGNDSPAVLVPNSTAANRAVNLPEFINRPYEELASIQVKALEHLFHVERGTQLAAEGKRDEALAEFEAAIKLQPDYWQAHVRAATVLVDQGKFDEAAAMLKKVLDANPERPQAHNSVGVVLSRRGLVSEAMAHFERAIQLDPNYAEAHTNLGRLLGQQGRLEEATARFFTAMDLQQDNPLAHLELAEVLLQRRMHELAIRHAQKAVELDAALVDAHLVLAKALAGQGRFALAAAQLEKAMAADPNNLRPVNDLAWLLATCPMDEVRNGTKAVQLAERACKATEHANPVLLGTLAAAYAELGRFPEAIATARKALGLVLPEDKLLAQGLREQIRLYEAGMSLGEKLRQTGPNLLLTR